MKKTLLTIAITIAAATTLAQSADTLFMAKLSDMNWTKPFSGSTQFRYIRFEDGSVLGIGDKMRFGSPSGGNQTSTETTGLFTATESRTNTFSYIMMGRMGMAAIGGIEYMPEAYKGREMPIENIKIMRSRRKDTPSVARVIFQNPGLDISVLDVKFAMQFGELINPKATMTSDQALAELKKVKDKFDLGLISQKKYDSLKVVLSKHIK